MRHWGIGLLLALALLAATAAWARDGACVGVNGCDMAARAKALYRGKTEALRPALTPHVALKHRVWQQIVPPQAAWPAPSGT